MAAEGAAAAAEQGMKQKLLLSLRQLLAGESPDIRAAAILAVGGLAELTCAALMGEEDAVRRAAVMQLVQQKTGAAAAADVEVCAEVVHLSIEGGGAPFSMACPLYNRKLQVVAIEKSLAAKRLSLLGINGSIPTADDKGYTVQTYEPGSTVNITAEPRADDSFKEGDLQEQRKQRYWSAFQSVLTVLMTVMTAVSVVVVTRLMQRVPV